MNIFRKRPNIVCTNEENPIRIKTHQFSLKLLSVLHDLEAEQSCDCIANGVAVDEIVTQMTQNFNIDGDVKIQIMIGLQQLLAQGLIVKISDENEAKYKLVGPIASVMQTPENTTARVEETKRVLKIFWRDCKNNCKGKCSNIQNIGRKSSSEDMREAKCRKYQNNCISKSRHTLEKKRHMQKKLHASKTNTGSRHDKNDSVF